MSFTKRNIASITTKTTSKASSSSSMHNDNEFSFGVIADVQWANTDDGTNYAKTVKRCYRGAFTTLSNAVQWWNNSSSPLLFIAQLGDLIDGVNHKLKDSEGALRKALEELDKCDCPTYHLVGNHELYNFDRKQLAEADWLKHGDAEYYSFAPHPQWKIIVLDPYQLSLMGLEQDDPRRVEAVNIVCTQNPNVSPDGSGGDWFQGMEHAGYQRRFVPYNGGFGSTQLSWLKGELQDAASSNQRVIILSHVIVHPKACGGGTMAWDYDQALDIIQSREVTNGCVVSVMCGHDHNGNYHCDEYGIHHLTYCSPLNKGEEGYAYGLVKVGEDGMEVRSLKMDDLIPCVDGRPEVVCMDVGDGFSGPCERLVLPFVDRLEVKMRLEEGDIVEEEKKEEKEMTAGGSDEILVNDGQAAA